MPQVNVPGKGSQWAIASSVATSGAVAAATPASSSSETPGGAKLPGAMIGQDLVSAEAPAAAPASSQSHAAMNVLFAPMNSVTERFGNLEGLLMQQRIDECYLESLLLPLHGICFMVFRPIHKLSALSSAILWFDVLS